MKQNIETLSQAVIIGIIDSQFGALAAWLDEDNHLLRLSFHAEEDLQLAAENGVARDDQKVVLIARQIDEYQQGKRTQFDIPLKLSGTPFQMKVWQELRNIPFGETISYGTLANRIGNPNASRAVGGANGCNPISVIIPCHRVIGANGSLTGYEGGVPIKEKLLAFEKRSK
ncbi:MAG: methylated-DNA--[protein]-cysteine S-methyltransferase [Enterobacteriaceae bacterium]|jgi:methylated-DNA-[protein]-cysteine S-methyltransferase|nr:methylated-DNA--[protein]-cysteine S-methyltransferase [Enterobacteriaceae bacterium]